MSTIKSGNSRFVKERVSIRMKNKDIRNEVKWIDELKKLRKRQIPWKIDPTRSSLIVIDMQNLFVAKGAFLEVPEARRRVPMVKQLLNICRKVGIPIFYTVIAHPRPDLSLRVYDMFPSVRGKAYIPDSTANKIYPEVAPQPGEMVIEKVSWSAFCGTNLDLLLRGTPSKVGTSIDTLLFCGTVTNVCVESTMRHAYDLNYKVVMIEDACAALDEDLHKATVKNVSYALGRVVSTDYLVRLLKGGKETVKKRYSRHTLKFSPL